MDITKELKKDGMLLKKIPKKEQTIDICKMAIRQNPLALQFVFGFKNVLSSGKKGWTGISVCS